MRRQVAIAIAAVAVVGGIAASLSAAQSSLAATNAAATTSTPTIAQQTQRVFDDTNEVRAEAGTTPLVRNSALDKVAMDWAKQQSDNGAMSHNPNYSTQIPSGWSHAGENVAAGYTYTQVVPAWKASAEHYKNLVGDYTDLGIGEYTGADGRTYWVQEFAKYASTKVPPKQTPTNAPSASATPSTVPSTAPSSTPTSAKPTPGPTTSTGGYPAEPAAPAGTVIPLKSPSFEASSSGWSASSASLDGPNTNARGGKYALVASGGQTISQTVTTTVTAGETDTVTIWVEPGSSAGITGSLKLTALGGTTETATMSFSDSSGWMKVSVGLPVSKAGHTGLRIDVVLSNSGRSYRLDSASLVRTKNAPAAASPAPSPTPSASSTPKPTPTQAPAPSNPPSNPPSTAPKPAPSSPAPAPAPSPSSSQNSGGLLGFLGLGG